MNNSDVMLTGRRLRLVPYLSHHVPRYHQWMTDPELLAATCSEPLTLEEEYENQKSWLLAKDKLTFIILAPLQLVLDVNAVAAMVGEGQTGKEGTSNNSNSNSNSNSIVGGLCGCQTTPVAEEVEEYGVASPLTERKASNDALVMIGDCNLFVQQHAEGGEVEVEVMIAETAFRGKGLAKEAVSLLMCYAMEVLGHSVFVAKILASNSPSRALFEKSELGFALWKEVKVFGEVHLIKRFSINNVSVEDKTSGDVPSGSLTSFDSLKRSCGYECGRYTEQSEECVLPTIPVAAYLLQERERWLNQPLEAPSGSYAAESVQRSVQDSMRCMKEMDTHQNATSNPPELPQ